jgi:HK97 family phage prohead protease/HK97 family phage major capsid protein
MSDEQPLELTIESDVAIRSESKREIDVRLAPFDTPIETVGGPEEITAGAFRGTDPGDVYLMGMDHEIGLGLGQDGKPVMTRPRAGRALSIEEREDGGYATFRVAKTAIGDRILEEIREGLVNGVSVEMGANRRVRTEKRNGRRTSVVEFADLRGLSPTYKPAYAQAQVLAVRSQQEVPGVATEEQAPDAGAPQEPVQLPAVRATFDPQDALTNLQLGLNKITDTFGEKLERLEERARSSFEIPGGLTPEQKMSFGQWAETSIKMLAGDRIPDQQFRVWQEIVTTDNLGVVPDAYSGEIIGVIDARRPFMSTTTRIPVPASGMNLVVPKINQRPAVDRQVAEKDEIASQKTLIGTESFGVKTYAGGGDLSLQLLRRSDPSFLELYVRLLAEAYAIETEDAAVASLITAINDGGPEPATALNPEALALGAAFETTFSAMRRAPDTIWLSSEAVGAFINALASGTNAPLYSNLAANFTAGGGTGGTISGLRPVHVPALDDKGAYAIVGPASGFAWAEDGTYTLQVDVPRQAGRDVALVGMVWHIPWYPEAFTLYNVAS